MNHCLVFWRRNIVNDIPSSRHTIERRIEEINMDLSSQLNNDVKNCVAFSLALDVSIDITDQPHAILIRLVLENAETKEELLDLIALKDTTREIDIKEAVDIALQQNNVPKTKLVSVATDGAATMIGENMVTHTFFLHPIH